MKSFQLVLIAAALLAAAAAPGAAQDAVAQMSVGAAGIEWLPQGDHGRAVLTVSAPDGTVTRQEREPGQSLSFSQFDDQGQRRPDGVYTYEITTGPRVPPRLQERIAAARAAGDDKALADLAARLPKGHVQSGSFAIANGSIVVAGEREPVAKDTAGKNAASAVSGPRSVSQRAITNVTAADQVIPDDLIVQGSLCVGFDCVNNESFGFDTIRLKENNTRIKFEDTSVGTFPTNDWQLTANDSASGGSSKFSIEDITGAKVPFTITAGASTNSIFVDSTGRVGFRTSTPVLDLHVATSNTPAIRLEQNNSGGFTAQTWDIAGNEANFFVRDVTGGSRLPFRIRPGAPTSSIDISADGDVGIGTGSPEVKLHVFGSDTGDTFNAIGPDPDGSTGNQGSFNFGYGGTTFGPGAGFLNTRPTTSATGARPAIYIMTQNLARMVFDKDGNIGFGTNVSAFDPSDPLVHQPTNARLTGGNWTNGSSRAIKHDIRELETSEALAALFKLAPVRYRANSDSSNEEYLGFIAEDVPDLVAFQDRKSLSPMDFVAVLTRVVQEQQKTIEALSAKVEELEKVKQ